MNLQRVRLGGRSRDTLFLDCQNKEAVQWKVNSVALFDTQRAVDILILLQPFSVVFAYAISKQLRLTGKKHSDTRVCAITRKQNLENIFYKHYSE
jgi:hypothetical protein